LSCKRFLLHQMLHSSALLESRLRERLSEVDISPNQARIIVALSEMGPASQTSLAEQFEVKSASMSTMTARLIKNGYIKRQIDPNDKRANLLFLTKEGVAFLDEIYAAWSDIDDLIKSALGAEDTEVFIALSTKIKDQLGGFIPGSMPKPTSKKD